MHSDEERDRDRDADDEESQVEDEEEEEEEEKMEEEPRLKYQRMSGSVPALLSGDTASCISVSERMIALGTHGGRVHLLDYQGNQVREFTVHTATVNELSFDAAGEFVGSCSDDGSVVVSSLYTNQVERFEYHRPMKAVALDPDYCKTSRFAGGGLAGQLILNSKGWFGPKDQVLHSGEGPIHAVKWRTSLIAWANDEGVKLFDTALQQRLTFIQKPKNSPRAEHLLPQLVWQDDVLLLISWGNRINVAAIRVKPHHSRLPGGEAFSFSKRFNLTQGTKYVEIVAVLNTDYLVCGLAPYGESLVVLAYVEPRGEDDRAAEGAAASGYSPTKQTGHAQRPEVCIRTWRNEELSTEALPVHGYEHYKAKDYSLAHAPFSGSSSAGGQWTAGDEPLYYIVSPKDVVVARQRDADDHVQWLLEHGWHEKALHAVETTNARVELLDEVGAQYLDHLILERQYAQAASLCPKILRGSASAWERWVYHFAKLRQLHVLAKFIPVKNPQLRDTMYELVLHALLINPAYHEQFRDLIRSWPKTIYSPTTIIQTIEYQCKTGGKTSLLLEALAELYLYQKQYENVIKVYLELQKPVVFDIIERHNMYAALHGKISLLVKMDPKRAINLLVQLKEKITPREVVSELDRLPPDEHNRRLKHEYLHFLFERDQEIGAEYHNLQVELYAEYEPRLLLDFLRNSRHYNLSKAYDVCTKRNLVRERVHLLAQLGNAREALALIINNLKSMELAVEFVTSRNDEDMWEELIKQSLQNPEMTGALLDHTVGNIEPMHVIRRIPHDMSIPRLRDRVVKVLSDYKTETSLRQGCNNILKSDRVNLHERHYSGFRFTLRAEKPSCCICSDSLTSHNSPIICCYCGHFYHASCLQDLSDMSSRPSSPREPLRVDKHPQQQHQELGSKRCVLCTQESQKKRAAANGF